MIARPTPALFRDPSKDERMNLARSTRPPTARRTWLAAMLFAASIGTSALAQQAQQDTVVLKDGKTETGKIKSEDFANLTLTPAKGPERTIDWPQVAANGITYGGSIEFTSAKEAFEQSRFDEALEKIAEILKPEAKLRAPLKQNAQYYLATIRLRKGEWDAAIAEFKKLQTEFPKSRYLLEIGDGLLNAYLGKGKDYAGATKALDELSSAALSAGVEGGFNSAINVLKGRIFEEQQKYSEAIGAYSTAEKATGIPPVVVQQARLGQARCLVATGKATDAEALYHKVVTEDAPNSILAGAWNGLGDLWKKPGYDKKDANLLNDALFAYLRGFVQYGPLPGESTYEYERAMAGAAQCFTYLSNLETAKDKKDLYAQYARQRKDQLAKEFPNSTFLK
jgi:predicted negative regulator of RcsB-dependent stress response